MSLKTAELTLTLEQLTRLPVGSFHELKCARPAYALVQRAGEDSWVFSVCVNTKPFDPAQAFASALQAARKEAKP